MVQGTRMIQPEVLREYEEQFLSKIPHTKVEYFTLTSLCEFLSADRSVVKRDILWIHGVRHHRIGAKTIITYKDLREWLKSKDGIEWVRDRVTRGRMKQYIYQRVKAFMEEA